MARRVEHHEILREIQDACSAEAGVAVNAALLRRSCPRCGRELLRRPTQWTTIWECPICHRAYLEQAPLIELDPAAYRPAPASPPNVADASNRSNRENPAKPAGRARASAV